MHVGDALKQYKMEEPKQRCSLYLEEPKKQRARKQITCSYPHALFAKRTLGFQNCNVNVIKEHNKNKMEFRKRELKERMTIRTRTKHK